MWYLNTTPGVSRATGTGAGPAGPDVFTMLVQRRTESPVEDMVTTCRCLKGQCRNSCWQKVSEVSVEVEEGWVSWVG